jgi:hypothetical protein
MPIKQLLNKILNKLLSRCQNQKTSKRDKSNFTVNMSKQGTPTEGFEMVNASESAKIIIFELNNLFGLQYETGVRLLPPVFLKIIPLPSEQIAFRVVKQKTKNRIEEGIYNVQTNLITWEAPPWYTIMKNNAFDQLEIAFNELLEDLNKEGCPCRYPRVRALFELTHYNADCVDAQLFFSLFLKQLLDTGKEDNIKVFECTHCKSLYRQEWEQLSINFDFYRIRCELASDLTDLGAPVDGPIPLCMGFEYVGKNRVPSHLYVHIKEVDPLIKYLRCGIPLKTII